jgi:hypothetical protein
MDSLESLTRLLGELIPIHEYTESQLDEYFEEHPDNSGDEELEKFGEICEDLWLLEHKIKLKAEIAILMSAIQAEDDLNQFCVFNIHKDIAESIEKLSPPEKLLVASTVVGRPNVKGSSVFEAIRKLSSWRNAFAHGHCVDRPVKSLRHNHLIEPAAFPGVPDSLAKMKDLVNGYLKLYEYLRSISLNSKTKGRSYDIEEVREHLKGISQYEFGDLEESNSVYSIRFNGGVV